MTTNRRPLFALYASDAVSLTGNAVAAVAIPWFVLEETGSAALTGLAGFFTFLPTVLASFFGGALVDRLGFRATSVAADIASAAAIAAIPALDLMFGVELWQVMALVFLGALFDAPGTTAREALLPDVAALAGMGLERATGLGNAIHRGSLLAGAPLAGILIGTIGTTNVLWIDAVSFVVSAALVVTFVPRPARAAPVAPAAGGLAHLLEGFRFVKRDRLLRAVVVTVLLTNFLDAPISTVLLPVFAREEFGGAVYLGAMVGTFGGAALVGALLFGAFGARMPRRRTFVTAFFVVGLTLLGFAALPPLPVTMALLALTGLAAGPINPILGTVGYERVPAELRGRVFGAITAGAWASIPAGLVLGGLVVEWIGVGPTFLAIGIAYVAVTGYGFVNSAFDELDRRPEPQPA